MIGIIFSYFSEVVEVRIDGNNVLFRTSQYGGAFVPIEGLRLDKNGVFKEHPDLVDKENWREEAINRFKEHIKKLESETLAMKYIIDELGKVGYKPIAYQRQGHRPQKIKDGKWQ